MIKNNSKKGVDKSYRWFFKPISWRVYDGDTLLDLVLDLGFGIRIKIKSRLKGINAPEVRGSERKKGLKTKLFLGHAIEKAFLSQQLLIESHLGQGKYGRWLITVWDGDINLNELMVEKGLAEFKEY
jgi:micrococcal nuclease